MQNCVRTNCSGLAQADCCQAIRLAQWKVVPRLSPSVGHCFCCLPAVAAAAVTAAADLILVLWILLADCSERLIFRLLLIWSEAERFEYRRSKGEFEYLSSVELKAKTKTKDCS